jgi:hypothetical protein
VSTPSFSCPLCHTTTWHPSDVAERYCPECHAFPDDVRVTVRANQRRELGDAELERLTAGTGFTVPRIQRALGDRRA